MYFFYLKNASGIIHFCYEIKLIYYSRIKNSTTHLTLVPICSLKSHYVKQGLIRDKRKKRDGAGHGLRTPNEAFFHRNPKNLGLGRQFGQINLGAFGVFLADLSAPVLVLRVHCPCFPLINHHFYKIQSLYIQIPNIYLGLGFEFGSQRIRDLVIVCP